MKTEMKMDYKRLLELRDQGFAKNINLKMTCLKEGYASGVLEIEERHKNPIRSVHGGVLFTLADTIGGAAAISRGRWCTTISGNINYVNPAIDCKKLLGETREIKSGKKICVYEVIITDETGKIIAVATMTYFFVDVKVTLPSSEKDTDM